ncbi:MAG: cell surface protein, partial [Pseudomonadota bacterium]
MTDSTTATANATSLAKTAKRPTALQYLDRALGELKSLGFAREGDAGTAPIIGLLNQISDLDEDRVAAIARTLDQASH